MKSNQVVMPMIRRPLFRAMAGAMLALAMTDASADDMSDRMQQLRDRIAELEQQPVASDSGNAASKFKINGFLSAGVGMADTDDYIFDDGLNYRTSETADSVVGLQIEGKVNQQVSAVLQLVARGRDDFDVGAEWAYIGYRPTDADELRIGRLRSRNFLLSEFLEVGYAYPWARPPAEVYQVVFPSSFDGVAWLHKFNGGSWQHDLQLTWGGTKYETTTGSQVNAEDSMTLAWTSAHDSWLLGATATQSKVTLHNPLFDLLSNPFVGLMAPVERDMASYLSLGAQYDDGRWLAMVELTQTDTDTDVMPDTRAGYATLGYRVDKFLPHLTYASTRVTDNVDRNLPTLPLMCPPVCMNPAPPIPFPADSLKRSLETEQDSVTLGLRYDFRPNVAVKLDWTRVLDTHGTFGLFNYNGPAGKLTPLSSSPPFVYAAPPDDEIDIYRIVVDVTF